MTIEDAKKLVGNQPEWALKHIIKSLGVFPILNTPEDNERLKAAKIVMAQMKKDKQK